MEQQKLNKLVEANMHKIYAWCMAKVYHRQDAEDLAADIIYSIIKSGDRIKNDDAFYGYMWKIARNSLLTCISNKRQTDLPYDETTVGVYWQKTDLDMIHREQLAALRRELSILSGNYREATVQYYIHSKSCAEISANLQISVEMVKYYLFQSRKILKEGIEMTRNFGEKSYAPGIFRPDFWGGNNSYRHLFKRKLPGNILLAAFGEPLSLSELSVELGVAAVYLEDEVNILCENELLKKTGTRYQTNIVIIPEDFELSFSEKSVAVVKKAASELESRFAVAFTELQTLSFHGKSSDENTLKWQFLNVALMTALLEADEFGKGKFGQYPQLSNGSYGFVYGFDNDFAHHKFNGIYGDYKNEDNTAMVSVENYRIIEDVQHFIPYEWTNAMNALIDAILENEADEKNDELIRLISEGYIISDHGHLSANFAVFPDAMFFGKLKTLLAPTIETARETMKEVCLLAGDSLATYMPEHLKKTAKQIAYIKYQMDTMAYLLEQMLADGSLEKPADTIKPCMFGLRFNTGIPSTTA